MLGRGSAPSCLPFLLIFLVAFAGPPVAHVAASSAHNPESSNLLALGNIRAQGKPPRPQGPSFGPPPNENEMSVLNAARSFTDNITDPEELDRAISYAVTFLTNNSLVAQVARNENSVYVTFKSGSSAGIFGSLAGKRAPARELLEVTTKQIVVGNLRGAQPPQGRAAVVLSPFHWQDSSDPSYAIYNNYMVGRLYPSTYSAISYVPNDYVTLDEVANFFLGWHISDFSWVVNDNDVLHVSHGMFSMTTHGGIFNGYTAFLTGECYDGPGCGTPKQPTRGSGIADYNAYYSYDSATVFVGIISGDSRRWIAFSSAFVWDFMYAADYSSGEMNSLFYADACESLKQADMAERMAASGIYTYLGWTESVHYPDPSDYALDIFFNGLTSGKTAAQAYQDVKNAGKDYDWLSPFAHLYYYPGPDTTGSPWFSSGNHGGWTVSWPNTYPYVSTDKTTYAQLESILFTGTGFTPGGSVLGCLSIDNDVSLICSGGTNADSQGNVVAGTMLVGTNIPVGPQKFVARDLSSGSYSNAVQLTITSQVTVTVTKTVTSTVSSTSYITRYTTTTVTSYTSTSTSTSTIPTVTTVVLVPLTITSTEQSTQFLTSVLTTTATSYTSTTTSTSTIPTTVALVPLTMTSTAQSTQYLTSILTTTVTSYTSTETLTSTIPTVTTVVLLPSSVTSTVQSTQLVTSILTTTVTSYTSTETLTSTIPTVTTVVLLPSTVTSTTQGTQYLTSILTTTVTNYTSTTTSTSTSVVYTTVTESPGGAGPAGAGASSSMAYAFMTVLAIMTGHRFTAGRPKRVPKVRAVSSPVQSYSSSRGALSLNGK